MESYIRTSFQLKKPIHMDDKLTTLQGMQAKALLGGGEERIAKLVEGGTITAERGEELREEARTALTESLAPAYSRVIQWFTEDRANADAEARGASALTDGADYYNHQLNMMTTTPLFPPDVD